MKATKTKPYLYTPYYSHTDPSTYSGLHKKYGQQLALRQWIRKGLQNTLRALYHIFHSSLSKLVTVNQDGQQVLIDIIGPEGSFLPRYSYTGTAQVLYMLPVNSSNKSLNTFPFTAIVKPLDENCYELIIEGTQERKESLGINIYGEANTLLYSEQIMYNGHFKRLYDLKWPHLTEVSFEVISKHGPCKAEIR